MEDPELHPHKNKVHHVLAHSYAVYFAALLLGMVMDLIFKFRIFQHTWWSNAGVALLFLGTALIVWAQYTSGKLSKDEITIKTFSHGPYRYTRTPTNFGLLLIVFGFGMMINSFFIVFFTFISFFIAKFVFLNKEEKILAEKYGAPYLEYKKKVKF